MAHGGIALFGALVHAANAHRNGKSKTLADFCILMVMASFTGVMFSLLALHFFPEQIYLTACIAGTGGYLGVEGMTMLVDRIKLFIINSK